MLKKVTTLRHSAVAAESRLTYKPLVGYLTQREKFEVGSGNFGLR